MVGELLKDPLNLSMTKSNYVVRVGQQTSSILAFNKGLTCEFRLSNCIDVAPFLTFVKWDFSYDTYNKLCHVQKL